MSSRSRREVKEQSSDTTREVSNDVVLMVSKTPPSQQKRYGTSTVKLQGQDIAPEDEPPFKQRKSRDQRDTITCLKENKTPANPLEIVDEQSELDPFDDVNNVQDHCMLEPAGYQMSSLVPSSEVVSKAPDNPLIQNEVPPLDASFILETWRLTNNQECLRKVEEKYKIENIELVLNSILKFLRGQSNSLSCQELLFILKDRRYEIVGNYIAAIMVIQCTLYFSIEDILEIYHEINSNETSAPFKILVTNLSLLMLQREIQKDTFDQSQLSNIPPILLDQLNFDFLNVSTNEEDHNHNNYGCSEGCKDHESTYVSAVRDILHNMQFTNHGTVETLLDANCNDVEKIRTRSLLTTAVISSLYSKNWESLFAIILNADIKRRFNAEEYFSLIGDTEYKTFALQKGLTQRFGQPICKLEHTVLVNKGDVENFIKLYLDDYDPVKFFEMITVGIYRMAKQMKIYDIFFFLFRGKFTVKFLLKKNKKDLFNILIWLKAEEALLDIAKNYSSIFPMQERFKSLNGLEPQNFVYMASMLKPHLDAFDIYKLLIQWSFSQAGIPCEDEEVVKYDSLVDSYFQQVYQVLDIQKLSNHFGLLFKQQFVKASEISVARMTLAQAKCAGMFN